MIQRIRTMRRIWPWEAFRIDTLREIEIKLHVARHAIRHLIVGRSRARSEWPGNISYSIVDFQRDWIRMRAQEKARGISARVHDLFLQGTSTAEEFADALTESSLDYFALETLGWDRLSRFVAVVNFLYAHREALLATPEKILAVSGSGENAFPTKVNALFLHFLLGGYEDPIIPGEEGWHPLQSPDKKFNCDTTLSAFREWLAAHGSSAASMRDTG